LAAATPPIDANVPLESTASASVKNVKSRSYPMSDDGHFSHGYTPTAPSRSTNGVGDCVYSTV
jgi:hypothetical protein